ncbi:MAG: pantoate--beta-alanine ligase [Gemmataceae bacterium]|nr:pantoate--beta-alanine ligase [Gemmataceae bacterium]
METATTIVQVRQKVSLARKEGKTIGFVPTMGALHEGHASLIRTARERDCFTVVSLFVNPKQFGPREDFHLYPRPLQADLRLCETAGAALAFHPSAEEIYPLGFQTSVEVEGLGEALCGRARPGHFRGVTTVVLKLFNQVLPDIAFFGQKDAQQALILRKMVRDLDVPVEMVICPTVRETDGLAMSSRNRYLSPLERERAPGIYQALLELKQEIVQGARDASELAGRLRQRLKAIPGAELDYADLMDTRTLAPVGRLQGEILAAVAVRFGSTRLIDNLLVQAP